MPTVVDASSLSYISAHSADVILSDIRPITLKQDALRAINVLLDEFLYKILSTSASLATDKLRASLLTLLPTSLGKEALLEAEVELRAYWERTEARVPLDDDSRSFHLQWAFELLRLKCEAYSTLNEHDENPAHEHLVNERLAKSLSQPPKPALVAPAALYLTAIIESMCEHILSNVGRVAARDSSRTNATISDLFVALCEDDSIYGLFRSMKVYEQIEVMSKTPKARRSKSFSRSDRISTSRTSSSHHDSPVNSTSGSRTRQSLEGHPPSAMPSATLTSNTRTSMEKTRALRMFAANSKGSGEKDAEAASSHKKSESIRSEGSKHFMDDEIADNSEDAAMLREFDDLMKSTSTMKVSLTPDRLKTMEVYKQEKDQRSRRPPPQFSTNTEPEAPSVPRHNKQSSGLGRTIVEEEENSSPKGRTRQASVTNTPSSPFATVRTRSVSTSNTTNTLQKPSRTPSVKAIPPSSFPSPPPEDMVRERKMSDSNGFPARTRRRQRNRDSMDLDDIMNGSDDEKKVADEKPARTTGLRKHNPTHVSAATRELIDFLAEGPPDTKISKNGKELVDFLAEAPPGYGSSAVSLESPKKGGGRLQRMMSKLNIGNGDKVKNSMDSYNPKTPTAKQFSTPNNNGAMSPPTIQPKYSNGTLSSLANRPIPPRPPRTISPPSTSSGGSTDENKAVFDNVRKPTVESISSLEYTKAEKPVAEKAAPPIPSFPKPPVYDKAIIRPVNGSAINRPPPPVKPISSLPQNSLRTPSPPTTSKPEPLPSLPTIDILDTHRLISNATTADECRLIFDMFMIRNGVKQDQATVGPYPSPTPSIIRQTQNEAGEAALESSLVELLLGGALPQQTPDTLESPPESSDTPTPAISPLIPGVSA